MRLASLAPTEFQQRRRGQLVASKSRRAGYATRRRPRSAAPSLPATRIALEGTSRPASSARTRSAVPAAAGDCGESGIGYRVPHKSRHAARAREPAHAVKATQRRVAFSYPLPRARRGFVNATVGEYLSCCSPANVTNARYSSMWLLRPTLRDQVGPIVESTGLKTTACQNPR